ncbi:hypothetical protein Q3G72_006386 [Acer saccharum]|nr:hypothetical protein Q3G72_006386 [Acer saccharum]
MPKEEAKDDGEREVVTEIPTTTNISDSGNDEVQQEVVLEEPRSIAQERPRRVSKPPQRTAKRLLNFTDHEMIAEDLPLHLLQSALAPHPSLPSDLTPLPLSQLPSGPPQPRQPQPSTPRCLQSHLWRAHYC